MPDAPALRITIRTMSGLDQGPQSRQHRGAAREKRDLEPMTLRQWRAR
jgi:hypothetical protein